MVEISESSYNDKPTLVISEGDEDRFPFSFGVAKARRLQAALSQNPKFIQEFLAKHETPAKSAPAKVVKKRK